MQRRFPNALSRRRFLNSSAQTAFAFAATAPLFGAATNAVPTSDAENSKTSELPQNSKNATFPDSFPETTFSLDGTRSRFYSSAVVKPLKILQISDAHLFLKDDRDAIFRENFARMGAAYNRTQHVQTGAETNPIDAFREILDGAVNEKVDAIVLTGDILSFPSAANVDFVRERLEAVVEAAGIPFYYVAGNHDWHFEGLSGTSRELRDEWIDRRLRPLYPSDAASPLAYSVQISGVRLLFVDNSIYEILPEQLEYCRKILAQGGPTVLFTHIPLYAPGRSVAFGCGNPNWNASTDRNFEIERRPRWPENGCSETSFAFRREMLGAPNVIGAFSGHIHVASLDICAGKPLYVSPAAVDASFSVLEFRPTP